MVLLVNVIVLVFVVEIVLVLQCRKQGKLPAMATNNTVSSWWFQPIWKICAQKIGPIPQISGWKFKILETTTQISTWRDVPEFLGTFPEVVQPLSWLNLSPLVANKKQPGELTACTWKLQGINIIIPPGEKENHLQNAIFGGYVSSLEGIFFFFNMASYRGGVPEINEPRCALNPLDFNIVKAKIATATIRKIQKPKGFPRKKPVGGIGWLIDWDPYNGLWNNPEVSGYIVYIRSIIPYIP